jgi:hypothetical protein
MSNSQNKVLPKFTHTLLNIYDVAIQQYCRPKGSDWNPIGRVELNNVSFALIGCQTTFWTNRGSH